MHIDWNKILKVLARLNKLYLPGIIFDNEQIFSQKDEANIKVQFICDNGIMSALLHLLQKIETLSKQTSI